MGGGTGSENGGGGLALRWGGGTGSEMRGGLALRWGGGGGTDLLQVLVFLLLPHLPVVQVLAHLLQAGL